MTIYLDYAATTPVDPRVAEVIVECLTAPGAHGNAASATHGPGLDARARVEAARAEVAALIGAQAREIIFTSGATESNNLALLGATRRSGNRGHIVSARTEHRSVLDTLRQLEKEGCALTLVEPDEAGCTSAAAIAGALRTDTFLVSVMHANNEIGSINDVRGIAALCRERGVLFHSDASQSAGKIPIDVAHSGPDLLSLTAHKIHGPKGIGALYVREAARPRIAPVMFGGGHERALRPGTLPTHQVAGFGRAAGLAREVLESDAARVGALRGRLMSALGALPGVLLNTPRGDRAVPGIVNASFEGVEGESLVTSLTGLAVSTGSACSSASGEPSYVLRALGRATELAQSSLRLSFGRFTTEEEIDAAVRVITREVSRLRTLAGGLPIGGAEDPSTAPVDPESLEARTLTPLTRRYFRAQPRPPLHAGALPHGYRRGQAGKSADGTAVSFELENAEGIVKSARFTAYGCPHTLAVAAWMRESLEGTRAAAGTLGTPFDWAAKFAVPHEKLGRLLIVEDALRAALG